MLLYLFALRAASLASAHFFHSRHAAAVASGSLLTLLALAAGLHSTHPSEVGPWVSWLRFVSPARWTSLMTASDEFSPVRTLRCSRNPVVTENSIIKQVR